MDSTERRSEILRVEEVSFQGEVWDDYGLGPGVGYQISGGCG